MKIRGREISKSIVVLAVVALFCVGLASAALVGYIGTITATATVTASTPVQLSVKTGWTNIPEDGIGYAPGPSVNLGSFVTGSEVIANIQFNNSGIAMTTPSLGMSLGYLDNGIPAVGDPNNCGDTNTDGDGNPLTNPPNGNYTGVTGICYGFCGATTLCLDGQEFELVGIRNVEYSSGAWRPWPDNDVDAAGNGDGIVTMTECNAYPLTYWVVNPGNPAEGLCFIATTLPAFPPANPVVLPPTPITQDIPNGIGLYSQILIIPKADSVNGVQAAPGDYSLTVTVQE